MTPPGVGAGMAASAAVAALLVCFATAGCLDELQDDVGDTSSACDRFGSPSQVPMEAPEAGGSGSRFITVEVLGPGGGPLGLAAVVAWWQPAPDRIEVIQLRTPDSGKVGLAVPADEDVTVIAGLTEWTHEGHMAAGPPSTSADLPTMVLTASSVLGSVEGTWESIVAEGATGAVWQPNDLPWAGEASMARLERLDLMLTWTNGAQGGADFGIGVGPGRESEFHYTNREYQTSPGPQSEDRTLDAAELADLGWDASTRPQAGPSVSTGAFAVTSIAYTLAWEATFAVDPDLPDRCQGFAGLDAVDVTDPEPGAMETAGTLSASSTFGPRREGRTD